jgi:hypothetical protein
MPIVEFQAGDDIVRFEDRGSLPDARRDQRMVPVEVPVELIAAARRAC